MKRNNALAISLMASADPVKVKRIENRMLVAQMIHNYLELRGMSRQSLAIEMGKQASEISKWLSGDHNFTIDTLSDIGYYLDIDFFAYKEKAMFRCNEEIEISRPGVRASEFDFRVSRFIIIDTTYMTNKKIERCPA